MTYFVYCHTNRINGKKYVGITSQHVHARWQNGKHYARHSRFYSDILKFGWENFDHDVIASGLSKEDAEKMERELIDSLDLTNEEKGYNFSTTGIRTAHLKDEAKEKLRAQSIGKNNPFYNHKHSKETKLLMSENRPKRAVMCIETGIVYKSTREAERQTKIDHADIIRCCKGLLNKAGGYQWKYEEVI